MPGHAHDCQHWSTHRQGASKLSIVEPTEGQSRSSLMAALVTEADAKRRCVEASPTSMVGNHVSQEVHGLEECELGRLRTQTSRIKGRCCCLFG